MKRVFALGAVPVVAAAAACSSFGATPGDQETPEAGAPTAAVTIPDDGVDATPAVDGGLDATILDAATATRGLVQFHPQQDSNDSVTFTLDKPAMAGDLLVLALVSDEPDNHPSAVTSNDEPWTPLEMQSGDVVLTLWGLMALGGETNAKFDQSDGKTYGILSEWTGFALLGATGAVQRDDSSEKVTTPTIPGSGLAVSFAGVPESTTATVASPFETFDTTSIATGEASIVGAYQSFDAVGKYGATFTFSDHVDDCSATELFPPLP